MEAVPVADAQVPVVTANVDVTFVAVVAGAAVQGLVVLKSKLTSVVCALMFEPNSTKQNAINETIPILRAKPDNCF